MRFRLLAVGALLAFASVACVATCAAATPGDNLHELAVILAREELANTSAGHVLLGPGNGSLAAATPAKARAAFGQFVANYSKIAAAIDVSYPSGASAVALQAWADARRLIQFELSNFRGLLAISGPGKDVAVMRLECDFDARTKLARAEDTYRLQVGADIKKLGQTDAEFTHLRWSASRSSAAEIDFNNVYGCLGAASGDGRALTRDAPKLSRAALASRTAALRATFGSLVRATSGWPDTEITLAFRGVSTAGEAYWSYEASVFHGTAAYSKKREDKLLGPYNVAVARFTALLRKLGNG